MIPLHKHIGYVFMTDKEMQQMSISNLCNSSSSGENDVETVTMFLNNEPYNHKHDRYWVTQSVIENLDLLKIKTLDWSFFFDIEPCKKTFLLPDNSMLRILFTEEHINVFYSKAMSPFVTVDDISGYESVNTVAFTIYKTKDDSTDSANNPNVKSKKISTTPAYNSKHIDNELIYKIFCFVFLSEPEEVIVQPGHKHGTKKSGKLVNASDFPIIVVNKNWNITSIRTEGFKVSGHFAIRHTGPGRGIPKLVLIAPFEKRGYVRKASKPENQ
jgi:hypothetical protein